MSCPDCAALRAERDRYRAALEKVEWAVNVDPIGYVCPACGASQRNGHWQTCWLSAALAHPAAAPTAGQVLASPKVSSSAQPHPEAGKFSEEEVDDAIYAAKAEAKRLAVESNNRGQSALWANSVETAILAALKRGGGA
jgi:hypothetical protein